MTAATAAPPRFSYAHLWTCLMDNYATNERDPVHAYGDVVYQKAMRVYSDNRSIVNAVIVTNQPVTEDLLNSTFKQNTFVAAVTLRRQRGSVDSQPLAATSYLAECRVYRGPNTLQPAQQLAAISSGPLSRSAASTDQHNNLVGMSLMRLVVGDDDVMDTEEDDHEPVDDTDGESDDDRDDDADSFSASTPRGRRAQLAQKGRRFGAKGLSRQHWALQAYRNFFHKFLFAVKSVRVIEQLNLRDEDSPHCTLYC